VRARSSINGSTKTETPMVCPGPVIAAVTVARTTMRHPTKRRTNWLGWFMAVLGSGVRKLYGSGLRSDERP
jgi:hypothetical protein